MTEQTPSRLPAPRVSPSVAPTTNAHLDISEVTKDFGSQAVLKGVNLSVARGGTTRHRRSFRLWEDHPVEAHSRF